MRQAWDVLCNASEHRGFGGKLWLFTVILPRRYMRPNYLCHTPESQKETSSSQASKGNERGAVHQNSFGKPPSSTSWAAGYPLAARPQRSLTQTPGSQLPVYKAPFKSTFHSEHLLPQARSQWSGSGWRHHSFQPSLFVSITDKWAFC